LCRDVCLELSWRAARHHDLAELVQYVHVAKVEDAV